jgi:uncharacterized protein (TIGR03437 family)
VSAARLLLAVLLFRSCSWAQGSANAPAFLADSVVNSANRSPASLTPNVLATIDGTDLALSTASVSLDDIGGGSLPTVLAGVRLKVGGIFASLLSVSPTQVNFIVPSSLVAGQTTILLTRGIRDGPMTPITLLEAAPATFQVDSMIAAVHPDGSRVSADAPAHPGEVIIVYCTGLGRTNPGQIDGSVPRSADTIAQRDQLQVFLDGQAIADGNIWYAGITPGSPGLYEIDMVLPDQIGSAPEVRIAMGDQISQESLRLPVSPAP